MIKLKRLVVDKIDPSVNKKGEIEFYFQECYICESQIGGIFIASNSIGLTDNWVQRKCIEYTLENNIRVCTILTTSNMPEYTNIIVDETVKELINRL